MRGTHSDLVVTADRIGGQHMITAGLILAVLIMMSLPVESHDDFWLRAGIVAVALGISLWVPFRLALLPVLLLALAPSLIREILGEERNPTWSLMVEAGCLILFTAGARLLYITNPRSRFRASRVTRNYEGASRGDKGARQIRSRHSRGEDRGPRAACEIATSPPSVGRWPAPQISAGDAVSLLDRLDVLAVELLQTAAQIRVTRDSFS